MNNGKKEKAVKVKEPAKKRKPSSAHSKARSKAGPAEIVAQSSAQPSTRVQGKRGLLADESRSTEAKDLFPTIGKTSSAILPDDSMLDDTAENRDVVRFTLAEQVYGLPVMQIVQVLRIVAFNVVPDSPDGMLGVIDFRGKTIPLIDLRRVFDLPSEHIGLNTPVLVARVSDRLMGLVVDEVVGVSALSVGIQIFTDGSAKGVRYISGVTRLDGKTMLIVDLEELEQQFPDLILKTT